MHRYRAQRVIYMTRDYLDVLACERDVDLGVSRVKSFALAPYGSSRYGPILWAFYLACLETQPMRTSLHWRRIDLKVTV